MRILIVNVNTTASITEAIARQAQAVAAPGTEIVGLTPYFGADSVEGNFESYLAAIAVMDRVLAYDQPYDAVIQAGYGEHGREGLQELLDVPVVDITEAGASTAMFLGHAYSVVTTLDRTQDDKAEVICLGCGGMAGLDEQIRQRTGVPVVDGVTAAVTIAESLVRLGLSTSKVRTYAKPRPKQIIGWPGHLRR